MSATKKILIAGACIFPEGSGGAVRCMHMLAKGFAANGHHVEVATTYGADTYKRRIEMDGFVAYSFGLLHDLNKLSLVKKLKSHLKLMIYLIYLTVKKRYDIIFFYGPGPAFVYVGLLAKIMKRRVAYLMADIQPKTANMKISGKLKRLQANIVDISLANISDLVVILGTSKLVRRYARFAPKSSRVQILAPVDTDMFASGNGNSFREKYGLKGKEIVTYSGALDKLDGIHILIEAIKSVAQKHPNVVLVIAGSTGDIDRVVGKMLDFKLLAQEHGVADFTIFTGHLQMQNVIDLLNASNVLVMPKIDHPLNHAASPIKIAEYLAAGRPIVTSRICELDRHLTHKEHVYFCESGNTIELTDAINFVLENEALSLKLSKNASSISKVLFDYRTITGTIYERAFITEEANKWLNA
ncbi:MAG: glycosyltransferase family 4 protein [Deltaproteobacteria bacterium]|nr:glycosyltransferase family 4 protein [Deltaproteobacteria bacterium]